MNAARAPRKPWLPAASALVGAAALLAGIRFGMHEDKTSQIRDPFAPALDAPDVTGERGPSTAGSPIDMQQVEDMARAKFGPMPEPPDTNQIAALNRDKGKGALALEQVRRIRQIRQTQGSAAALAALKAQNFSATP